MGRVDALKREVKRVVGRVGAAVSSDAITRIARSGYFRVEDIGWISDSYFKQGTGTGTPWDALRHAHLELPGWFQPGLDPWSDDYAAQQHRLWQLMSGIERPYVPDTDEKEQHWGDIDPIRSPGYFARRDAGAVVAAADQLLATGMILKHSGLQPGGWALEYGAGFGQTALAFARLGVNVDTVDISSTFCDFVRRQAEFFQVPLTPFAGHFGVSPRPGQKYDLIWFYESFHHSVDFQQVVHRVREQLAEGGCVILGGEPIVEREYAAVPYPWGLRLHSEVAAVVRRQHWFELGFSEDFLVDLFVNAGFVAERIDCPPSLFGRLYIFRARPAEIHLGRHWLPTLAQGQWHGAEPDGRWTTGEARLPVDAVGEAAAIELDLSNHHASALKVEIDYGGARRTVELAAGEQRTVRCATVPGARALSLRCQARRLTLVERLRGGDRRALGVFVRRLRYVESELPTLTQRVPETAK